MRKVLIPTDFSKVSKNAIVYALNLYKNTHSSFTIIHVYQPSFDPAQHEIMDPSLGMQDVKKENMHNLIASISSLANKFGINIKSTLEVGFTIETIVKLSEDYDMIVMGSTGSNNIINKFFGGISTGVASKSKCPVLLIPGNANFTPLQNILYAFNMKELDTEIMNSVIDFAKRNNSMLHFVQIGDSNYDFTELPEIKNIKYTTNSIKTGSFAKEINKYIKNKDIDMLIVATKHRKFWDKLFHKSFTKKLALNALIPLLVYHKN